MKAMITMTVAAASFLFCAGSACAAPTMIGVQIGPYTCTLAVTKLDDPDHDVGNVLLAATASDCGYQGAGAVGKVRSLGSVATLSGTSSLLGSNYELLTIFEYPFVNGGTYWAYYTGSGKSLNFLDKGTYSIK